MIDDLLKKYPELTGMDQNKLDFILAFAQKDKPKTTKDAMPFLLSYMSQAKKLNINFSKPEIRFVCELFMQDMSPEEKARVQKMLDIVKA